MKLGIFIDSDDPGGAESIIIDLSRNLILRGYLIELYLFENKWIEDQAKIYNIKVIKLKYYKFFKSIYTLPFFILYFAFFLKNRKIKILHSHLIGAILAGSLATRIIKIPHVGTIHDVYSLETSWKNQTLLKISGLLRTKLITVSNNMKSLLEERIKNIKLQTVYNGVDLNNFMGNTDSVYNNVFHKKADSFYFISVGRLISLKRFDLLIEAFSHLKSDKDIKLLIVGDGTEIGKLNKFVFRKKLNNKILFLGFCSSITTLLKLSDCFVLTSDSEGLSISIIEALAASLPVIATKVGGNSELVFNRINGFLIEKNSLNDLIDAMQFISNNKDLAKRFGGKSFKIYKKYFSIEKMLQSYLLIYNSIMSSL